MDLRQSKIKVAVPAKGTDPEKVMALFPGTVMDPVQAMAKAPSLALATALAPDQRKELSLKNKP